MGALRQFWSQPQRVWLRKALFQIHLWTGIGAGIYVLLISISGSAIVFKNEIYRANDSPVIIVEGAGERMSHEAIEDAAERVHPGFTVIQIYDYEDNPKRAVEVRLEKGSRVRNRLFDPYLGTDLGGSVPWPIQVVAWFEDLHISLFADKLGRQINAAGGVLWTLLALTGLVVWWQGIQNWKRGLLVRLRSGWRRLNWDLHSSLGFWTLLLTLMWGVTGIFAAIPDPFRAAVDYLEPLRPVPPPAGGEERRGRGIQQQADPAVRQEQGPRRGRRPRFEPRVGDKILRGAYAVHFGNFAGTKLKIAWVVLGLVPGLLFLTGLLIWINRKFRRVRTT